MSNRKKHSRRPRHARQERPLLSVCMIVKNEQENLDRCLRSVRSVADEIVVVDTGSSDRTVEIALRHGAKVSTFEWCDDFSAARNVAKERATGRWILQIDADEALTAEAQRCIRTAVSDAPPGWMGYYIPCRSYELRDGHREYLAFYRLVLFRNHPDLRYAYRIHEQLQYIGQGPQPEFPYHDALVIEHFGYLPDQIELKQKHDRNLRLLQQAVLENPEEPFHQFNLGNQYCVMGRYEEAVDVLLRVVADCDDPSRNYLLTAYESLLMALYRSSRASEVPEVVRRAEQSLPVLTADFHCFAGEALQAIGELDQAISCYRRAIDLGQVRTAAVARPYARTWLPRLGIGSICESRGELERARDWYEEALTYAPQLSSLNARLAIVLAKMGDGERAVDYVGQALQTGVLPEQIAWELLQMCEHLHKNSEHRASASRILGLGGALARRVPPTTERGARLAEICVRFGEFERGLLAADASLQCADSILARVQRGLCNLYLGRHREAAEDFARAESLAQREGPRASRAASVILTVSDGVERTRRCLEAIAENTPDDLYEMVIVDDGSTDDTRSLLALLEGDVKIHRNEHSLGATAVLGQGAQLASGRYLVFLLNDAEPRTGWLETLIGAAESDRSVDAVALTNAAEGHGGCDASAGAEAPTALLVRRDVWETLARTHGGNVASALSQKELCSAVRQAGLQVLCLPASAIGTIAP